MASSLASIARTAEHLASDLESDAGANHPDVARDARGFARAARDLHRLLGERQPGQVQERALGVTLEWWERLNGRLQELRAPRFEHTQQVATQLEPEIARLQQGLRR